jgi:hypothetical protein
MRALGRAGHARRQALGGAHPPSPTSRRRVPRVADGAVTRLFEEVGCKTLAVDLVDAARCSGPSTERRPGRQLGGEVAQVDTPDLRAQSRIESPKV